MFRGRGYIYSALILFFEIFIGGWVGGIVAALTTVYALFIGDWIARKKYKAILCEASLSIQRHKLQQCFLRVSSKVNQKYTIAPKNTKIYIIPDPKIQAYAFGFRGIGVTEGALNLDSRTLEAVIAHEYGHIINGDSVLGMTLSATATSLLLLIVFYQFFFFSIIYFIIIVACLFGLFKFNLFSIIITDKLNHLFKRICGFIQNVVFLILQVVILAFGRKGELLADSFAFTLGYGFYLRQFLDRFDVNTPENGNFIGVLFETHPPKDVRIRNLDRMYLNHQQE